MILNDPCATAGATASASGTATSYAAAYRAAEWGSAATVDFSGSCSMTLTLTSTGVPPVHNDDYLAPVSSEYPTAGDGHVHHLSGQSRYICGLAALDARRQRAARVRRRALALRRAQRGTDPD